MMFFKNKSMKKNGIRIQFKKRELRIYHLKMYHPSVDGQVLPFNKRKLNSTLQVKNCDITYSRYLSSQQ